MEIAGRTIELFAIALLLATFSACGSIFGAVPELPTPTGPFAVGRITYHWTDSSRAEPLGPEKRNREVMVYVWYPAARSSASTKSTVPYLPDFQELKKNVSDADLEDLFRPAYSVIQHDGYPQTHAIENARMPSSGVRYPLLVFSHGLGFVGALYAAELEDLASHGYAVAAIDHTYDTTFTLFPDGRFVNFAQAKWDAEGKKPGGFINYVKERVEVWAADTRFVIDQLTRYNSVASLRAPFAGRLDLSRIGAFGHSVGGLVSARVCQLDRRVRACSDQDSDIKASPFVVDRPGKILDQPFLFLVGPTSDLFSEQKLRPSDASLSTMKLTRAEYDASLKQQQDAQNKVLSRVGGGSFRVLLASLPGFTHRSFSDLQLLSAHGDPVEATKSLFNFNLSQLYTRSFFDKYLRGLKGTLLDRQSTPDSRIKVDSFSLTRQRSAQ